MKRRLAVLFGLAGLSLSSLALASTGDATAAPVHRSVHTITKVQKVPTKVKLSTDYDYNDPNVTFYGSVVAKQKACVTKRKVSLRQMQQKLDVGTTKATKTGAWALTFNGDDVHEGKFRASVDRLIKESRTVRISGGKKTITIHKTICLPASVIQVIGGSPQRP